jgi:hypothetical protein
MSRRFWMLSAIWIAIVIAASPLFIELLDGAGLGFQLPGLTVTQSEILVMALVAFTPALVAGYRARPRRQGR